MWSLGVGKFGFLLCGNYFIDLQILYYLKKYCIYLIYSAKIKSQ